MCCAVALAVVGCTEGIDAPRDIPIAVSTVNDAGDTRFFVDLELSGHSITAMLDTGSSGLRVLPAGLANVAVDRSGQAVVQRYNSGLELDGVLATAPLSIGDLETAEPVAFMAVDTIGCASASSCPATGQTADTFTFSGATAILGVGMRTPDDGSGIGNPIVQLPGSPAYIVQAPAYAGTTGTLRIQPSATDIDAFVGKTAKMPVYNATLLGDVASYDDQRIETCVTAEPIGSFCHGAMLDTGDPPVDLYAPNFPDGRPALAIDTVVDIELGDTNGMLGSIRFTVADQVAGVDKVVLVHSDSTWINLGTLAFYHFDVLFDQPHGLIGLVPHS